MTTMEKETNSSDQLADMLNSPENYTEEQWHDFLSTPEGRDAFRLYRLAQKALAHKEMTPPDSDDAWRRFSSVHTPKVSRVKYAIAWTVSAAAILVAGWFIAHETGYTSLPHSTASSTQGIIAFERPEDMGQVTLQSPHASSTVQKLGKVDSISFFINDRGHAASEGVQTISIPSGQDCKVTLPDGSQVYLNAGSSLTFPTGFTGNDRTVSITGEAYFKVKHNDRQPFIVQTEKMLIRDLGTEFLVRNYPGKNPSVILVEGVVSVSPSSQSTQHVLKPGECSTIDAQDSIHTATADVYAATQWMHGYFYFTSSSLMDVLTALARWYDKGILIRNEKHLQEQVHFSAERKDSLPAALENLNQIQQARLKLEGEYIVVE